MAGRRSIFIPRNTTTYPSFAFYVYYEVLNKCKRTYTEQIDPGFQFPPRFIGDRGGAFDRNFKVCSTLTCLCPWRSIYINILCLCTLVCIHTYTILWSGKLFHCICFKVSTYTYTYYMYIQVENLKFIYPLLTGYFYT